jgi:ParB family transcriptional regulator, chromosome partitioning protein
LRLDYTQPQITLLIADLSEHNQQKDIARLLSMDPGAVSRYLKPLGMIAPIKDAYLAGALNLAQVCALDGDERQQHDLYAEFQSGRVTTCADIKRVRQRRTDGDQPKAARLICPLPSGHVVTVRGDALTLSDAIEAVQEWLKAARKAEAEGIDIKTFARICKDKAPE